MFLAIINSNTRVINLGVRVGKPEESFVSFNRVLDIGVLFDYIINSSLLFMALTQKPVSVYITSLNNLYILCIWLIDYAQLLINFLCHTLQFVDQPAQKTHFHGSTFSISILKDLYNERQNVFLNWEVLCSQEDHHSTVLHSSKDSSSGAKLIQLFSDELLQCFFFRII